MHRKSLVINPFEYRYEEIEAVRSCIDGLKGYFDTYVVLEDVSAEGDAEDGVTFVDASSRKRGYLEVTADYVIDAGAVTGASRLSSAQKRICVSTGRLRAKYPEDAGPEELLAVVDYYSGFDMVIGSDELKECGPEKLAGILGMDKDGRTFGDIIFLMEYLEQDDENHGTVLQLAEMFKREFGAKLYAIGLNEISPDGACDGFFDKDDVFDIKLSTENNPGTVRNILIETGGIVVICDKGARYGYRNYLKENRLIYMYKGAVRKAGRRISISRHDIEDSAKWKEIFESLTGNSEAVCVEIAENFFSGTLHRVNSHLKSLPGGALSDNRGGRRERTDGAEAGEPLVSVVIPFYNNNETIKTAVDSIKNNGYGSCEIIIVNDGSDEDPLQKLGKDDSIRFFRKSNSGPGSARNLGIDQAKGKYVFFLDADDVSCPGAIKKLVDFAEENGLGMVCGKTIRKYAGTGFEEAWCGDLYRRKRISLLCDRGPMVDDTICTGKIFRTDALESAGLRFKEGVYEDNLFMSRVYSEIDRIGIIPDIVEKWMIFGHNTSISTRNYPDNAKERFDVVDEIYRTVSTYQKYYYTRQYIRHQIIVGLNGYIYFDESEKEEIYGIIRKGLLLRRDTILDRMILMPSKKKLYRAALEDDREGFDRLAAAFSADYFTKIKRQTDQ